MADEELKPESQSLSGWDGVFHARCREDHDHREHSQSQSLSGWDGVFHRRGLRLLRFYISESQSLSGWDGVFHRASA